MTEEKSFYNVLRHARVKRFREVRKKTANTELELRFEAIGPVLNVQQFKDQLMTIKESKNIFSCNDVAIEEASEIQFNILDSVNSDNIAYKNNNIENINNESDSYETACVVNDNIINDNILKRICSDLAGSSKSLMLQNNSKSIIETVEQSLRKWGCNITLSKLDELLKILHVVMPNLPTSARTFLRSKNVPKYNIIQYEDNSEYVYFGIANNLKQFVNPELHVDCTLSLQFNIDGLSIFHSSLQEFWPILCKIFFFPDIYKPFPVAIYMGNKKPHNLEVLFNDFIKEINILLSCGIDIEGKKFSISIKCFICDKPARSLIKRIKGHGGFGACERCSVHGFRSNNRTVYASVTSTERTNESFRAMQDPIHHTEVTPLIKINLPIDMINHFIIDFMHCVCLFYSLRMNQKVL